MIKDAIFISHSFQIYKEFLIIFIGKYTQFNYYINSWEPAKNGPVLNDLLDNCKSYLVQDKVELLKGGV